MGSLNLKENIISPSLCIYKPQIFSSLPSIFYRITGVLILLDFIDFGFIFDYSFFYELNFYISMFIFLYILKFFFFLCFSIFFFIFFYHIFIGIATDRIKKFGLFDKYIKYYRKGKVYSLKKKKEWMFFFSPGVHIFFAYVKCFFLIYVIYLIIKHLLNSFYSIIQDYIKIYFLRHYIFLVLLFF